LKSKNNSIVIVTTLSDDKNRNIIIPIDLSVREGRIIVNSIRSSYGRDNFSLYIEKNYNDGNILAINKEKANEIFQSIGKWYPKEETFISFDNSIAYSTANVKYISENFSEKEKPSNEETERNDNVAKKSQQEELLERIAALEKQVKEMSDEQQNLKEQIATVNQFVSAITESQNFEQSMSTIESMGKQVLDCGKAEFWCYDGAENKYFTNDENRGGRDWQIAKDNMRIAADTKAAHIVNGEAYIPIISNDKVAGILVASEKDGTFDKASLDKFSPNGQIANTIDLSLKKEFEHQGRITDELTRLKNRQGAKEYAANTMAHNVNAEKDMCLIMCDIDHFKSINDTYGHDAGDTVLKNVAGILQSGTRQGADSAFRWGGEEMVCVLNCDYDHAMDIAERLRQQIENTTHLVYNADKEPTNVSVTISMGVYQVKPDKEITQENAFSFFESQLKFADELAYKAKETGRNKVVGESDIMYEKNAEQARETAQEVITAGTIDKYGIDIDFKNISGIVLTTATENYIGGIDNNGHERRDNSELAVNEVEIYYSEYHNDGSLVRLESEDPFDMTITIDEALEEIQNFLDEALNDRDKNIIIKYNDGRKEYIDPNKLLEEKTRAEESYSIFFIDNGIETAYYRDDNTNINALVQRLADSNLSYPEISKNCTRISELTFAELYQMGNPKPAFCAEINLETTDIIGDKKPMELTVWDNEKIATISLDEAIQSIRENGTVNLDYQKFAENNDTVELTSEYLDFSINLDNAYDDFMYQSSIYNNEHIEFVDNHKQLPYDLNSAENRNIVTEYINIQLESGSNLSESQKATLTELKNQIDEIKEMESKLGIDEGDLKFIAETKSAVAWTDEAKKTLDERNAGLDEQDRDDPF
ncbi:MAG: GGDEF domain-containing protein, partial [Lachnospiraceae bacterium]|nr:GGDEF domain-containing protein [Lachnospiraceae bacterium]